MVVVSPTTGRRLIPLPEAARRLRRSYGSLYGAVLAGRLAAERIDGRWCVDEVALDEQAGRPALRPADAEREPPS